MELNQKLSKLRKKFGYSQEELSEKLQVSRQTISKWENGFVTPDSENLINIANFFDIDINELINDDKQFKKNTQNTKKSNKNNLVKKIILIIIIIFLLFLAFFINKIVQRYIIIDNISKNLAYIYLQNNDSFLFSKDTAYINTITLEKKYYSEKSYCKNDILKQEYYQTNPNINLKDNDVLLTKIEYRDSGNYYNINMIEKTYSKSLYNQEPTFFYNLTVSQLDSKIYSEFNYMSNFKEKILIALNFNYDIKILNGNEETDKYYYIQKNYNNKNTIKLSTSMYSGNYFLELQMENYNNDLTEITSTTYNFSNYSSNVEKTELIDLSNFKHID